MNLTSFTDYSLRILIILGSNPKQKYKTKDLVEILDIKLNHATKIINKLSNLNYIESYKGRFGGVINFASYIQYQIINYCQRTRTNEHCRML